MSDEHKPQPLPRHKPEAEIVLPSGAFAKIRRITWGDFCVASVGEQAYMAMRLASLVMTLDGNKVTMNELAAMDADDFFPILNLINRQIQAAQNTKDGIA